MHQHHHRILLLCLALLLCFALSTSAVVASAAFRNITCAEAANLVATPLPDQIILDVRTPGEFSMGHVPKALNANFFGENFEEELMKLDRGKPYIVYCRSGKRSAGALEIMEKMGFTDLRHMMDGFQRWRKEEFPIEH